MRGISRGGRESLQLGSGLRCSSLDLHASLCRTYRGIHTDSAAVRVDQQLQCSIKVFHLSGSFGEPACDSRFTASRDRAWDLYLKAAR